MQLTRLPLLLASILPLVAGARVAAAEGDLSTSADADARSDYFVAGGAGFAAGDEFGTSALLAFGQVGYRAAGSTWLLLRAGGGLAGDVEVGAEILDVAVGVETLRCTRGERLCAAVGADLGIRTGTYYDDFDQMEGDISGLTAALHGGVELRVIGPVALRLDANLTHFTATGTTESGAAVGLDAKTVVRF